MGKEFLAISHDGNHIAIKGRFAICFHQEGTGYIVRCPSLKLTTDGDDYDEAIRHITESIALSITSGMRLGIINQIMASNNWVENEHGWHKDLSDGPLINRPSEANAMRFVDFADVPKGYLKQEHQAGGFA